MSEQHLCELCGHPMPEGEEMFKFHGFSGECPAPQATKVKPRNATQLTDHSARAIREAHNLICWTWQAYTRENGWEKRGWWHVKDLDPNARDMMGAAEQRLYDALMKTPD